MSPGFGGLLTFALRLLALAPLGVFLALGPKQSKASLRLGRPGHNQLEIKRTPGPASTSETRGRGKEGVGG